MEKMPKWMIILHLLYRKPMTSYEVEQALGQSGYSPGPMNIYGFIKGGMNKGYILQKKGLYNPYTKRTVSFFYITPTGKQAVQQFDKYGLIADTRKERTPEELEKARENKFAKDPTLVKVKTFWSTYEDATMGTGYSEYLDRLKKAGIRYHTHHTIYGYPSMASEPIDIYVRQKDVQRASSLR